MKYHIRIEYTWIDKNGKLKIIINDRLLTVRGVYLECEMIEFSVEPEKLKK